MKWENRMYKNGETRIRSGFLFIPKTIYEDSVYVTKWLEYATWEEVYSSDWDSSY